ncbi:MAG: very short patch repair endonuclease [bacterium]
MDNLTKKQRHKNMQNIRSANTTPERIVANELRKNKIYFAKNVQSIIGKPDFVFRKKKVVLFIDSDFWHGHKKRCIMPKSNVIYWKNKIARNQERDSEVNKILKEEQWKVIRCWEYDVKKRLHYVMDKVYSAISFYK